MIGPCLIAPDTFRAVRDNARARRARGAISELGGHFARKEGDMSADADDLFERVARAQERDVPTLDEVKAGLTQALDELEQRFPDGRPEHGRCSGSDRLTYTSLMLRLRDYRWRLEHGDYTEWPRELLSVEQNAGDERWQAFVDAHTEPLEPPTFSDEEILGGLRAAIESRSQPWLQGAADSSDVVEILLPGAARVENKRATALVIRTGKQLARLARQGHVVRLRQKWTKGRGRSIWSLPGIEVNEWWLKQFEADDAR